MGYTGENAMLGEFFGIIGTQHSCQLGGLGVSNFDDPKSRPGGDLFGNVLLEL